MYSEALRQIDLNTERFMYEEMKSEIAEMSNNIAEMSNTIAEKDNTIAEKDNTIAEKDNTIAELNNMIAQLQNSIEEMKKIKIKSWLPHNRADWHIVGIFLLNSCFLFLTFNSY